MIPIDLAPKAISDIIEKDVEGDLVMIVEKISFDKADLHLHFSLIADSHDLKVSQKWEMQAINYQQYQISNEGVLDFFSFYSDHYLLAELNDVNTELYFSNKCGNVRELLSDLYLLRREQIIPLDKYIKLPFNNNSVEIATYDYGLFAKGPKSVLEDYYNILERYNMNPHFVGSYEPKIWSNGSWIESQKKYNLAITGRTFVIAEDFKFSRRYF